MTNEEITMNLKESLKQMYPTARPRFIELVVDIIELHARKNNDYRGNSTSLIHEDPFGLVGRMHDIWRKTTRLFHILVEKVDAKVNENVRETALDNAVYSLLLAEEIEKEMNKNGT